MSHDHAVPVDYETRIGTAELQALRSAAEADANAFWLDQAKRLDWVTAPTVAGDWSFDADDFHIRWFADGTSTSPPNCLEPPSVRARRQVAIIFEGDSPATAACDLSRNARSGRRFANL